MMDEEARSADEARVRSVIEAFTEAVRARDVEAMMSHCASDIATFDMVPPLEHEGRESIRRLWSETLSRFEGPVACDVHELEVFVSDDVAFTRSLNRFGGTATDGTRSSSWLCSTMGLRKIDGEWKVVHEHVSVPFDMNTGKALLDLKP